MQLMGIGDEAGGKLESQIQATRELGWKFLEMRGVEVAGFAKGNFHDIPDAAFDRAAALLEENGLGVFCIRGIARRTSATVMSNGVSTVFAQFMMVEPKQ